MVGCSDNIRLENIPHHQHFVWLAANSQQNVIAAITTNCYCSPLFYFNKYCKQITVVLYCWPVSGLNALVSFEIVLVSEGRISVYNMSFFTIYGDLDHTAIHLKLFFHSRTSLVLLPLLSN